MDINKLTAMADRLSIPQLQQAMRDGSLPAYVGMPMLQQKVQESKQAQAAQAASKPQAPTVASQIEGEADQHEMMKRQALAMQAQMAGTGGISDMLRKPEPKAMAKGGAVAFSEGQTVPGLTYQQALDIMDEPMATPEEKAQAQQVITQQKTTQPLAAPQVQPQAAATPQVQQPQGLRAIYDTAIAQTPVETAEEARKRREEYLGPNTGIASLREDVSKIKDEATADKEKAGYMALMKAGLATMAGTSPFAAVNIGKGASEGVADYMDAQKEYRKTLDKQRDLTYKLDAAERQEKMDVFKFGEDSAAASRSANNALRIGQAKEENDTRLKEKQLNLEEARNQATAGYYNYLQNSPTEAKLQQKLADAITARKTATDAATIKDLDATIEGLTAAITTARSSRANNMTENQLAVAKQKVINNVNKELENDYTYKDLKTDAEKAAYREKKIKEQLGFVLDTHNAMYGGNIDSLTTPPPAPTTGFDYNSPKYNQ